MTDSHSSLSDDERRLHLRTDDDIYLEYRILSEEEYAEAVQDFKQQPEGYFNPINQLQAITLQSRQALQAIKQKDPDIFEYLVCMDEKIQLLAHAVAEGRVGIPVVPNEAVNISAGGMSFTSDSEYDIDSPIEVTIVIIPDYLHFYALGTVVYCKNGEPEDNGKFRIGVKFRFLHDSDRNALMKYVIDRSQHTH